MDFSQPWGGVCLSDECKDVYCGDDLQGNNHGDADVELLVLRLVAPHLQAQPCADTTADDGKQEEGGFGDAPLRFLGLKLVDAVDDEGEEVERQEDSADDCKHEWGGIKELG